MKIPVIINVAICLPARNERENLEVLLREIEASLDHPLIGDAKVIIFDDGSSDSTFEHLKSKHFSGFSLYILRSMVRVGKAAALKLAMEEAIRLEADAIVMMDADLQDDPSYIPQLLEALVAGHDVVNGRRVNRQHSLVKKTSSRAFNAVVRSSTGLKMWDINSGYKAYSRSAAQAVVPYLYGELHRVLLVVAVWVGLDVGEIRVLNRQRGSGATKYGLARAWRGIFDMWTIQFLRRYHSNPGHFFSGVGTSLVILSLTFFLLGIASLSTFSGPGLIDVPGWVSLGLLLFGITFISFGFLAELILFLSKSPPTSVIRFHDSESDVPPPRSGFKIAPSTS